MGCEVNSECRMQIGERRGWRMKIRGRYVVPYNEPRNNKRNGLLSPALSSRGGEGPTLGGVLYKYAAPPELFVGRLNNLKMVYVSNGSRQAVLLGRRKKPAATTPTITPTTIPPIPPIKEIFFTARAVIGFSNALTDA